MDRISPLTAHAHKSILQRDLTNWGERIVRRLKIIMKDRRLTLVAVPRLRVEARVAPSKQHKVSVLQERNS